ncbi:YpmS family protein [Salicibibacter cibarius]|uniref:YpmS family protein n=1 Tax=Salicibibacter cibarius TaxID=2743000 RepID=A0A7T6Z276_9BACI|nr:YpmS family protein [Salicibibacter cibarius]QQK75628.1 YpmS family protein [Salicibibacter cibarius]
MNWKWAFFILIGVNVVVIVSFWFLLSPIGSDSAPEEIPDGEMPATEEEVLFTAETSLDQISTYMRSETDDAVDIHMEEDEIVFTGRYTIFGMDVDLNLYLVPTVSDSGNLRLEENGMAIGSLNLPSSAVLRVIGEQADLPEFVHIYPQEGVIDVHVNDIDIGEDLYLRLGDSGLDNGLIPLEAVYGDA